MKSFNCKHLTKGYYFRRLELLFALVLIALFQAPASYADTPLGLSPLYKCVGSAAQSVCTNGYTYSTGGIDINQFQFIGYVFTSQESGTVPVYHAVECQTDPLGRCYPLGSSPQEVYVNMAPVTTRSLHVYSSELLGYVYPTQVSGTLPVYFGNICSGSMIIYKNGTVPVCVGGEFQNGYTYTTYNVIGYKFIAYVYPQLSFTVSPKYFIGSVVYVPPGQGPSSVTYGAGTVTGTTVSTKSSWSNESSVGLTYGGFSITFGNNFGGSTLNSVDMQNTSSQSTTFRGPPSNLINHDYDQIQVYLGVQVKALVDYRGHVTWSPDFSQIANQGFAETGYPISVGCLRANSSIPASQCTATLNFLSSIGITAVDYPNIIGADPFADPAAPVLPDPSRYVLVDAVNFLPNPTTSTITYNETNSSTITNTKTSSYSYSVSVEVKESISKTLSLKQSGKFTWTNESTLLNKTGSNSSSAFTLSLPSSPYSGPSTLFVYLDTIYKTFMFSFN